MDPLISGDCFGVSKEGEAFLASAIASFVRGPKRDAILGFAESRQRP